jgi:hypothetical protein
MTSLELVHGNADDARLIRERAVDRVADPPHCVRVEPDAPSPVELLDGAHEPQCAFLHEIRERQESLTALVYHPEHEAHVRLDEDGLGPLGVVPALANAPYGLVELATGTALPGA